MSDIRQILASQDPVSLAQRMTAAVLRISDLRSCFEIVRSRRCGDIFAEMQQGYLINGRTAWKSSLIIDGTPIQISSKTTPEELLVHAHPASFGRGFETVYDESVRVCQSIEGSKITHKYEYPSLDFPELYYLAPQGSRLFARLSKIHIYPPGGFFAEHTDTPQGENHLATLVMLLPHPHTGGALYIQDKPVLAHNPHSSSVLWAAFPPDVPHRVDKVTSGHRISAQFDIFVEHKPDDPRKRGRASFECEERDFTRDVIDRMNSENKGPAFSVDISEDENEICLDKYGDIPTRSHEESLKLANLYWDAAEGAAWDSPSFAVLLSHRYSWNAISEEIILRGADEPLISALRSRHPDWQITFHSVLIQHECNKEGGSTRETMCVSPFDPGHVLGDQRPTELFGQKSIPLIMPNTKFGVTKDSQFSPVPFSRGYTGNQCDDVKSFYIHMAALVRRPSAGGSSGSV